MSVLRFVFVLCAFFVSACAESTPVTNPATADANPLSGPKAYFSTYPDLLFDAFARSCADPSETLKRPSKHVSQCLRLMPPATTAGVVLKYDGDINNLPRLVINLKEQAAQTGHVVELSAYLHVPQKSGGHVKVVQNSRKLDAKMRDLLKLAGGKPL